MTARHMMLARMAAITLLVPLGGCGGEAPKPADPAKAKPAGFTAGEWEVSALTETLKAADQFAPASTILNMRWPECWYSLAPRSLSPTSCSAATNFRPCSAWG